MKTILPDHKNRILSAIDNLNNVSFMGHSDIRFCWFCGGDIPEHKDDCLIKLIKQTIKNAEVIK